MSLVDDVRDFPARCRNEVCAECGGMIAWRLGYDPRRVFGERTQAIIYCLKDSTHQGTRKPVRSQKPYGLKGTKSDELLHKEA